MPNKEAPEGEYIQRAIENLIAATAALAVRWRSSRPPTKEEKAAAILHIGIALGALMNSDPDNNAINLAGTIARKVASKRGGKGAGEDE